MVIPIYDNDPLDRNPYAFVTWTMIAINIVVFLVQLGASEDTELVMLRDYRADPGRGVRQGGARRAACRRSSRPSPTCSCMPAGRTSSATCCSSGCSATISRTRSGRSASSSSTCCAARPAGSRISSRTRIRSRRWSAPPARSSGVVAAYLMLRPVRQDHGAAVRLRAALARLRLGARLLGAGAGLERAQRGGRRYRLVGACRRARGRRRPDAGVPPARRALFECMRPGDAIAAKQALSGVKRRWGSR